MEHARAQIAAKPPSGATQRRVRRFVLRNVVARPRVLAAAVAPVRWYAGSRLRHVLRATRATHLLGRFRATEAQLPRRPGRPVRPGEDLPTGPAGAPEVVLFTGCVMGEIFGGVHSATARVLARNGVTPVATMGQGCCGALSAHDGDLEFARKLARANIAGLEGSEAPIIVNSAGCGAALKEYGDLLSHDSQWSARAMRFAGRVRDLSEYLVELGVPVEGTFEGKVTYQDPCHLAHAQRIREQPRTLLAGAGCELTETAGADTCCGAAGIYSLVQPEMSAQLRARKAEQFARHRPDVIVTGNPGCQMQYEAAVAEAHIRARVMHIAEVLDEAYARTER